MRERIPQRTARSGTSRRRLWILAGGGAVPALLLGAFGLLSLRHEQDLTLLDARKAAEVQATRLADRLPRALALPSLASQADLAGMERGDTRLEEEPLARLEPGTLARFFSPTHTYPAGQAALPRRAALDPQRLPSPLAKLRAQAIEAELSARIPPPEAAQRWKELLDQSADRPITEWARYRLGRCLVQSGRTTEAVPVLEAVTRAGPAYVGETGLPLDVLALRCLLQAAELDADAAASKTRWLDQYCWRVLIRGQLGDSLLSEWEGPDSERLRKWRQLAHLHERACAAIPEPPSSPKLEWQKEENRSWLRSVQEVPGGTWVVLRPEATVSNVVARVLEAEGLPAGTRARATLLGREITPAVTREGETPPVLAEARLPVSGFPDSSWCVVLTDPESLQERTRWRSRVSALLIALASATSVGAVLLAVQAYERQRQLASLQADFVASVTHELRAPLAAVRLMAEELVDLPLDASRQRAEYHRLILRETQRLGLLIENVLRHARLERGSGTSAFETSEVDLCEVARRSADSLRPCAQERDLRLLTELPTEPVWAEVDAPALQQVIVNLLDNALKHSPTGAAVRVGLAVARAPGHPHEDRPAKPTATLWVIDEGAGIPAEEQERIFESFYRRGTELRRETSGVGLGLALVKRIVEAHQGSVRVQSRPGAGARFTVELPLAETPGVRS